MSPEAFTEFLHSNIPLTAAMQLRVVRGDGLAIELAAPLGPNRNHQESAFGGSLATLAIVSGWALLHQGLQREGLKARIVVQKSECEFLEPAAAEFFAESRVQEEQWLPFLAALRKGKRARIAVQGLLRCAGRDVVRHGSSFVAIPIHGEPT